MGIKQRINKIFSKVDLTTGNENASRKEIDDIYLKNITDKSEHRAQNRRKMNDDENTDRMAIIRQEGSLWLHRHDGLDWHTMSIPHPVKKFAVDLPAKSDINEQISEKVTDIKSYKQLKPNREPTISKKDILAKFVIQNGITIGETISIDSNHLVFKSGADNLNIPISSIININEDNVTVGEFNRDESLKLGENWLHRTTNRLKFDENGMLIND